MARLPDGRAGNAKNLPRRADGSIIGGPGSKKGSHKRQTVLLKDAILRAAELAGMDLDKKAAKKDPVFLEKRDGLVAYLHHAALNEPKAFIPLLGKVLPVQLTAEANGGPITIEFNTIYEAKPGEIIDVTPQKALVKDT